MNIVQVNITLILSFVVLTIATTFVPVSSSSLDSHESAPASVAQAFSIRSSDDQVISGLTEELLSRSEMLDAYRRFLVGANGGDEKRKDSAEQELKVELPFNVLNPVSPQALTSDDD